MKRLVLSLKKMKGFQPKLFYLCVFLFCLTYFHLFGYIDKSREIPYNATMFTYPANMKLSHFHVARRPNWRQEILKEPPVNQHVEFVNSNEHVCSTRLGNGKKLLAIVIIKTAITNRKHRDMIRITWMNDLLVHNMIGMFLIGIGDEGLNKEPFIADIDAENNIHNDIIQAKFVDSYRNNTLKAIAGFAWVTKFCSNAHFAVNFDDDYYVNVQLLANLLMKKFATSKPTLIGWVYPNSKPFRSRFSKWYISVDEYPWSLWPPYLSAGGYVISMPVAMDLHILAPHVKFIDFDDVYVGILVMMLDLVLEHDQRFCLQLDECRKGLKTMIACHTVGNPNIIKKLYQLNQKFPLSS